MKRRRGNDYLAQLRRSLEAKGQQAAESPKPVNQMSEAELDAEAERLRAEVRAAKERTVQAGREELAGQGSLHPIFTKKRRRSPWK
jgi:hypothetical protein